MAVIAVPVPAYSRKMVSAMASGAPHFPGVRMVDLTVIVNSTYAAADTLDLSSIFPNKIVAYITDAMDTTGVCIPIFTPGASGSPVGCTLKLRRQVTGASTTFEDAGTQGNGLSVHMVVFGY